MEQKQVIINDGCYRYDISNHTGKIAITYAQEDSAFVGKIKAKLDEKKYVYVLNPILSRANLPHDGYIDDIGAKINECSCMIIVLSKNLLPSVNKGHETETEMPYPTEEKTQEYLDKRSKLNRFWYRIGQISARNAAIIEEWKKIDKTVSPVFLPIWAEKEDGEKLSSEEKPDLAGTPLQRLNIEEGIDTILEELEGRFKGKVITEELCPEKNASICINPNVFFGNISFHFEITRSRLDALREMLETQNEEEYSEDSVVEILQYTLRCGADIRGFVDKTQSEEHADEFNKFKENVLFSDRLCKVTYCKVSSSPSLQNIDSVAGILYFGIIIPISAKYGVAYKPCIFSVDSKNDENFEVPGIGADCLKMLLFGSSCDEDESMFKTEIKNGKLYFCTDEKRTELTGGTCECLHPQ